MASYGRAALALVLAVFVSSAASAGEHRFGFGYHYWETLDDIDSIGDIDDQGSAIVLSYQYLPGGLIRFEGDVEYFDSGFGGSNDTAYSPQVFVLAGRFVYGGVGAGITRSDGFPGGDEWSDPWFAARFGIDMLLLPRIHLDLNANYRANAFQDLDEAKSDAITFGASLRVAF